MDVTGTKLVPGTRFLQRCRVKGGVVSQEVLVGEIDC